MIVFAFFVFGLLIGSFVTVVVGRYGSDESIVSGRSRCGDCRAQIAWQDNIPVVSFVILDGKCRNCGARISWQYPATELTVGGLFALTAGLMGLSLTSDWTIWLTVVGVCAIFAALVVIAVYDLRTMQIPMLVAWVAIGLSVGLVLAQFFLWNIGSTELISHGIGGLVGFGFLWFLSWVSSERWMGAGDAYIGLIGGLLVGFSEIVFLLTLAFGLGAVFGICAILAKRAQGNTAVPFAPFIIVATIITVLLPFAIPNISIFIPYF